MNPTAILYPAIAMFALTFGAILLLGFARFGAVRRRDVRLSFYRTYDQGSQPAHLHLLARHVQNHFEVPPLFYAGVLLTFVSGSVNMPAVVFAWLYVATRCVHSYIHLGSNNVSRRFFTFLTSLIFLAALWLTLLYSLVTSVA